MTDESATRIISITCCLLSALYAQTVNAEASAATTWYDGDRLRQLSPADTREAQAGQDTRLRDPQGETYRLNNTLLVHFRRHQSAAEVSRWARHHQLTPIRQTGLSNAWLLRCDLGMECISLSRLLYRLPEVRYAYPDFIRPRSTRFVPDDPLFVNQWHLENTGQLGGSIGQDVDVLSTWDSNYTGLGIDIAVVDDGLEILHEDLANNVVPGRSWDYVDSNDDPTGGWHGTNVAGVAAGVGGNTLGITGVAPSAGLVGLRLLGAQTDSNEADALTRDLTDNEIYTNSWGPTDGGGALDGPGPLTEAALAQGITLGRTGKGSIYVWAGGNGGTSDNANYDGYTNSRFTISVTASTNQELLSWYSEEGANHLVTAPSNGGTLGITTTAIGNSYRSTFGGTSSAAPLVAGIVSLMLEARPDLGWRDVQQILANTTDLINPADPDWLINDFGYWINHKFGFGQVNATAAVNAAIAWPLVAREVSLQEQLSPALPIPDNNLLGVESQIDIIGNIRIESVDVTFTSDIARWGDLEIALTSPAGTESVLARSHNTSSTNGNQYAAGWRFNSMRLLGEESAGTWTLKVSDGISGFSGDLQHWQLNLYGTVQATNGCEGDPLENLDDFDQDTSCISPTRITADNIISNSAFVQYSAPIIELSPGFSVESGSEFLIIN